jgi:hypothetical protein
MPVARARRHVDPIERKYNFIERLILKRGEVDRVRSPEVQLGKLVWQISIIAAA